MVENPKKSQSHWLHKLSTAGLHWLTILAQQNTQRYQANTTGHCAANLWIALGLGIRYEIRLPFHMDIKWNEMRDVDKCSRPTTVSYRHNSPLHLFHPIGLISWTLPARDLLGYYLDPPAACIVTLTWTPSAPLKLVLATFFVSWVDGCVLKMVEMWESAGGWGCHHVGIQLILVAGLKKQLDVWLLVRVRAQNRKRPRAADRSRGSWLQEANPNYQRLPIAGCPTTNRVDWPPKVGKSRWSNQVERGLSPWTCQPTMRILMTVESHYSSNPDICWFYSTAVQQVYSILLARTQFLICLAKACSFCSTSNYRGSISPPTLSTPSNCPAPPVFCRTCRLIYDLDTVGQRYEHMVSTWLAQ